MDLGRGGRPTCRAMPSERRPMSQIEAEPSSCLTSVAPTSSIPRDIHAMDAAVRSLARPRSQGRQRVQCRTSAEDLCRVNDPTPNQSEQQRTRTEVVPTIRTTADPSERERPRRIRAMTAGRTSRLAWAEGYGSWRISRRAG